MSYLLDTCALSEFTKPKPAPSVDQWFASTPDDATFISVLTLGELEKGIHRLTSSKRRSTLERWFSDLRDRFEGRILGLDEACALEWGRISARCEAAGQPIPVVDALLAATAIVHGLGIVTRNTSDIARAGAPIIDPWQA
ncbi:MAG TPA: type II toxin-antitoxin system VapC family toxin [Kofleriaceae bacterium]|nr:type II toxin-antitoxin system VapC family toxin [Kofleriaceae bacterium]